MLKKVTYISRYNSKASFICFHLNDVTALNPKQASYRENEERLPPRSSYVQKNSYIYHQLKS